MDRHAWESTGIGSLQRNRLRIWSLSVRARGVLILMISPEPNEKIILMLLPRLERTSVESYWAHRDSGVRGALTKVMEHMESGAAIDPESVKTNILIGFEILKEAAREYLYGLG